MAKNEGLDEDAQKMLHRSWLVRPCVAYEMEHAQCLDHYSTYRGKTTTIYIEGNDYVADDCKKYMEDFHNCRKWRDDASFKALEKLLEREEKRLEKRQEAIKNNDVWEYRTSPPEDFNVELPKRLQHREVENGRKQACTIS